MQIESANVVQTFVKDLRGNVLLTLQISNNQISDSQPLCSIYRNFHLILIYLGIFRLYESILVICEIMLCYTRHLVDLFIKSTTTLSHLF